MGDFMGEIEEIPFNVCGIIHGKYVIIAPIDDSVDRDFMIYSVFDAKNPDTLYYAYIPRNDVPQERSMNSISATVRVLEKCRGRSKHFPKLVKFGRIPDLIFGLEQEQQRERDPEWLTRPVIVVQHDTINLAAIMSLSPTGYVPLLLSLTVGMGMIRALAALHRAGFVHRLVSPHSFACKNVATLENLATSLMFIDLSLAMPWPMKPRPYVPFVGTLRYSSLRAHNGRDQCPADDIISVIYIVAEMISGRLPWRSVFEERRVKQQKAIFYSSLEFKKLPQEIRFLYKRLYTMESHTVLTQQDYEEFLGFFKRAIERKDPESKFQLPHWLFTSAGD
ncbi:hypothetical protein QR680_018984 [Steinernema hermaphroditum]|uniref:Protein kinase domain-containing protein n=1 Tax=Steinernema hermaphroditum TaxID=289476 RepID=A0AA39HJL9_9BILA|nr:hypothetical protein QR680_018984 [Steinernema hermaphroditum]